MDSGNNSEPTSDIPVVSPPTGQTPFQDVVPPKDSIGNPVKFDNAELAPDLASNNPIAGTAAPMSTVIHEASKDQSLDGVLREVTSSIKSAPPPANQAHQKKKHGFSLFGKKTKNPSPNQARPQVPPPVTHQVQQPQQPAAGPQAKPKAKSQTPVLAITIACIVAIILIAGTVAIYKK
jgi:hypothetical protein